jgi:hypothetical protein
VEENLNQRVFHGKSRRRWEEILKMDLKDLELKTGLDSSGIG